MNNILVKLILFSGVFALVHFLSGTLSEYSCDHLHAAKSISCSISSSLLLYVSLFMSIALSWKIKPVLAVYSGLMPIPMFIYSVLEVKSSGIINQLRPEVIDIFNYYLFSYMLPCLIVALAVSYATTRVQEKLL
jgi:hypothetical protein